MKLRHLLALVLTTCSRTETTTVEKPQIGSVISITNVPGDMPEFKRRYEAIVGDGFKVKIELRSWSLGRMDSSEVTQKNGRWILFDANRVADKIIDRELYPLVQAVVDQVLELDKTYIDSNPAEFIDEKGTIWRRVDK